MIDELTDDLTDDQAAETPNVPTDETPNETTEPADPKQRKRRAEHHAELLLGLANQSKQSSGDVDAADPTELELWDRATVLKFFGGSKPTILQLCIATWPPASIRGPSMSAPTWFAGWPTSVGPRHSACSPHATTRSRRRPAGAGSAARSTRARRRRDRGRVMSDTDAPDHPKCRADLKELAKTLRRRLDTLYTLGDTNDPLMADADFRSKHAYWVADIFKRFEIRSRIHARQIHYRLVSQKTPILQVDDTPYVNSIDCFTRLCGAIRDARYLDLISTEVIIDRRNPEPIINFDSDDDVSAEIKINHGAVVQFDFGRDYHAPSYYLPSARLVMSQALASAITSKSGSKRAPRTRSCCSSGSNTGSMSRPSSAKSRPQPAKIWSIVPSPAVSRFASRTLAILILPAARCRFPLP